MTRTIPRYSLLTAAVLSGIGLAHSPSSAQTGADFYQGKTVTSIIATAPGGGLE